MKYVIYKITNLINNKIYIGQTTNVKERFRHHKQAPFRKGSRDYNKPLYRAIRKYGLDNFSFEIIDKSAKSIDELNDKEINYIKLFDSIIDSGHGYNLESGGNNGLKSEYTKKKISEAHKGYGGGSFGKRKGMAYRAKKVICLETNKIYGSAIDCAEDLFPKNVSTARKQISKCASPNTNRFTYKWFTFRFVDSNNSIIDKNTSPIDMSNNAKGVKIINLDTKEIYNTISEASLKLKISEGMVRDRIYLRVHDNKNRLMIYEDFIANEGALTGKADGNLVPSYLK